MDHTTNRDRLVAHLGKSGDDIEPRYAEWAHARQECPVARLTREEGATEGEDTFIVYSHEGVRRVMFDDHSFMKPGPMWRTTRTLLAMNGDEHRAHRALVADPFGPRAMNRLEQTLLIPLMHDLIDKFVHLGRADLVLDYTSHYPFQVIRTIIGIDAADHDEFLGLAYPADGLNPAWEVKAREFLVPLIHAARVEPKDDLLGLLVRSELDGVLLTDEDILEYLLLLIPAGADTTVAGSSNMFAGLLLNPDQLELVRSDPRLVNTAVNEALRWQNPAATTFLRRALCPVDLDGIAIPENAVVRAHLSAHNRDAETYSEPDRFTVTRSGQPTGVFGYGPHVCLGQHLARAEMRAALTVALDRLPGLRLDPDAPRPIVHSASGPQAAGSVSMAAATSLPVVFDSPA
ncbi:cytochrome P450 [Nocardia sp. alder85J]|uniref:cytochrome P450 n=1 Tax=Nocardia sp. alder85J TaxID=2862949 RepID=UPI001CD2FAE9|nr:cytochrome P450 [Nocardia sp. alder85J]MCX4095678.1 cytochrome P450 [Nocardia sp. alder85J]